MFGLKEPENACLTVQRFSLKCEIHLFGGKGRSDALE
jgi:hypothetical protein